MEKCNIVLSTGERTLTEVKILRIFFQRNLLSSQLFFILMIPFRYILRKFTDFYKFIKSQKNINHLIYMDNIKMYNKNTKEVKILLQAM